MQSPLVFLIEHMEEFMYEWCKHEYVQMLMYLEGTNIRLCFTNFRVIQEYSGKQQQNNKKYTLQVEEAYKKYNNQGRIYSKSYAEILKEHGKLVLEGVGQYELDDICLLDMRGKQQLRSDDRQKMRVYLFGGILGDHPPRDRTKALREHSEVLRHLGQLQLSTDTAILTSKLILQNNVKLQEIPYVNEPEIVGPNKYNEKTTIQMQGFRYINKGLIDWRDGKKLQQPQGIYMSEGVRRLLLEQELDVAMFM